MKKKSSSRRFPFTVTTKLLIFHNFKMEFITYMTQKYESLSFCEAFDEFDDIDMLLHSLSVRLRVPLNRCVVALSGFGIDVFIGSRLSFAVPLIFPLPVTKPFTKLFKLFIFSVELSVFCGTNEKSKNKSKLKTNKTLKISRKDIFILNLSNYV